MSASGESVQSPPRTCPSCGREAGEQDRFCVACGAALLAAAAQLQQGQEQVLYRFGPMGIGITFGRPGVFKMAWQNVTEVIVTDQRLCGVRRNSAIFLRHRGKEGELLFNVPYSAVSALEPVSFLANRAVWLRYHEAGQAKEVSIIGSMLTYQHIQRTVALLARLVPVAPGGAPGALAAPAGGSRGSS